MFYLLFDGLFLFFPFTFYSMVELAMALSQPDFKEFDRVVFPDVGGGG